MTFPRQFIWGASTSAYQIEGASGHDGAGESVWDEFAHTPGLVLNGDTGDVACDHYHRYGEDVALMSEIGLDAYRFSVAWARVMPNGACEVNEAGLAFYDRLVDSLLAANITPWVTLFHWDFPLALYRRGGWANTQSPQWFADYTAVVVDRLSDRVDHWITINEPQCFIEFGHGTGINAPGQTLPLAERLQISHNVLLAHGRSAQVIRERAKTPPQVGWAPVAVTTSPASDTPADIAAARDAMFSIRKDGLFNDTWFADPVCLGHYPEDGLQRFGADMPDGFEQDLATICQPLDFYGVNIYFGDRVRAGSDGQTELIPPAPDAPRSLFDWPITPEALRWVPTFLYERYGLPIVVTENGISCADAPGPDGHIHDPQRIQFLQDYLQQLSLAIDSGVDVRGYFHWSLLDNFEWAEGYKQQFGLIHVDRQTQARTLKDSARWYGDWIKTHRTP